LKTLLLWSLAVFVLAGFGEGRLRAADPQGPVLSILEENDLFAGTDRHYTQGFEVLFLGAERLADSPAPASRLAKALPGLGLNTETVRFGVGIGQKIYTPSDHRIATVQTNDRPYAGFLHLSALWQRRGETSGGWPLLDHLGIDLGVVGPESMAEDAQNRVHSKPLQGWQYQLKSEPGVAVKYARMSRFEAGGSEGWSCHGIPWAGLSIGSVGTYAASGVEIRAGYNLPKDFGAQTMDSLVPVSGGLTANSPRWGFYVFGAAEGRAVAYNTFLDGSMFHESPHVTKRPLVADLRFGCAIVINKFVEIGYAQVFRTKEFSGQAHVDSFGSVTASIRW